MKKIFLITFFLLFSLFILPSVLATNYYVDNAVATSGNGLSWATAWKNFANINWASVQAGDTIYVSGGSTSKIYRETLYITNVNRASSAYITVAKGVDAGHNGRVIIDGNSGAIDDGIFVSGSSHIYLKGFEIRQTQRGAFIQCDYGDVNDVVVDSFNIYEFYNQAGVHVNGQCDSSLLNVANVVIKNSNIVSTFENIPGQTDNIYVAQTTNVTIENNTLEQKNLHVEGSTDNIQFLSVAGSPIIRNNYMVQHGTHGDQCMILGTTGDSTVLYVYNNIALHLGDGNLFMTRKYDSTSPKANIYENTFVAAPQGPYYMHTMVFENTAVVKNNIIVWIGVTGTGGGNMNANGAPMRVADVLNNVFYREQEGVEVPTGFGAYNGGSWTGTGGQVLTGSFSWSNWVSIGGNGWNANPQFVSINNRNFRLQASSIAIDRGLNLGAPYNIDFARISRPQGSAYDIGAYEYVSGVQCAPADTDCNGCITLGEVSAYVSLWLQGQVTLSQVSSAVSSWLSATGC